MFVRDQAQANLVDAEHGNSPDQDTSFLKELKSSFSNTNNSMEWTDLTFSIKGKKILDGVTGAVNAGEIGCILGPSGAGKSTLLNILAGRMNTAGRGCAFGGIISMSGAEVKPVEVRSNIAYVMQEDSLPAMTTPRELLEMSAKLRLANDEKQNIPELVSNLLRDLRLEKCADTYVGSSLVKGISGGEKKRTAVATELITKPQMIFLDEPLSGLDSYAAWTVMQVCKELAVHGCAVLVTVHQPSSEIFELFDKCICLAEGRTVYCGATDNVANYMTKAGQPLEKNHNPADHLLFTVQKQSPEDLAAFTESWAQEEKTLVLPPIQEKRARCDNSDSLVAPSAVKRKPFCTQLIFLLRRELNETFRNTMGLIFRFGVTGVMGLFFAAIFAGVGRQNHAGVLPPVQIQSHFGAVCNLMVGTMFGSAQPLLLQFPLERPVFLREYAANMYGVVPYFLAKTLVEMPMALLTCLETFLISYWVMGLQGNFMYLVGTAWLLNLGAASTALMIGCSVSDAKSAQEFAPLMFVPQILFTGVFTSINLIPKALRWLQYLCALKYAVNLASIIELTDSFGGPILLESMNIHNDQWPIYVGVLVAIFVGFRLVAMVSLHRRGQYVF